MGLGGSQTDESIQLFSAILVDYEYYVTSNEFVVAVFYVVVSLLVIENSKNTDLF